MMSYLALARKWRPKSFGEVIGQEHVVSALSNALDNQRVHHAFLFTGTRGVGKTTLARIFAKALNCEKGVSAKPCGGCNACQSVDQGNFIDLIEVDAASRTKVDDTRELLDNVQYTPSQGRFKIYLIDEVHMLSTHSFNALLKTLEEPPEHVKFLLATTNPQKLPTTILSRCIQFNLKSVDIGRLSQHLENILNSEEITFEEQALMILARSANGSVRDSLSLLDQAIAFSNGNITSEQVRAMLGMIDDQLIEDLLEKILDGDSKSAFNIIEQMSEKSADYSNALDELLSLIQNVSLFQFSPESLEWKGVNSESVKILADKSDAEILQLLYQIALNGKRDFEYAPDPRSGFEMVIMRMLAFQPEGRKLPGSVKSISKSAESTVSGENQHVADNGQTIVTALNETTNKFEIVQNENIQGREPSLEFKLTNLESLCTTEGWQNFINESGINGINREILMNMSPQSVEGRSLNVILQSSSRHMFNNNRKKKIEDYFNEKLSISINLNVEIEDLVDSSDDNETPAQKLERLQREKEDTARQRFMHDNNVQELIDTFDAEIVSGSIKPSVN